MLQHNQGAGEGGQAVRGGQDTRHAHTPLSLRGGAQIRGCRARGRSGAAHAAAVAAWGEILYPFCQIMKTRGALVFVPLLSWF